MTDAEKLERLESLESMADSCVHEICDILNDDQYFNSWYRISDGISDKITSLRAKVEFEKEMERVNLI